jgi:hypothetical protein
MRFSRQAMVETGHIERADIGGGFAGFLFQLVWKASIKSWKGAIVSGGVAKMAAFLVIRREWFGRPEAGPGRCNR